MNSSDLKVVRKGIRLSGELTALSYLKSLFTPISQNYELKQKQFDDFVKKAERGGKRK